VAQATGHCADVFDMLGVIAHDQGNYPLARDWFERALAVNPNYTEARLNLIVTLNDLGDFQAAQALRAGLKRQTERGPENDRFALGKIANMHATLSQAYSDIGMPMAAIRELEHAVALCPSFPDLRTRLGVLLREQGERGRAREQLETACELNPDYVQARLMLGVMHLSDGELALARASFERVLAQDPHNPNAKMYLRITP
jgi:lipoprotein NlpI